MRLLSPMVVEKRKFIITRSASYLKSMKNCANLVRNNDFKGKNNFALLFILHLKTSQIQNIIKTNRYIV